MKHIFEYLFSKKTDLDKLSKNPLTYIFVPIGDDYTTHLDIFMPKNIDHGKFDDWEINGIYSKYISVSVWDICTASNYIRSYIMNGDTFKKYFGCYPENYKPLSTLSCMWSTRLPRKQMIEDLNKFTSKEIKKLFGQIF